MNGIGNSLEKVVIVPFCSHAIQENQLEGKEISLKTFLNEAKGNTSIEYEQVIFLLIFYQGGFLTWGVCMSTVNMSAIDMILCTLLSVIIQRCITNKKLFFDRSTGLLGTHLL